MSAIVEVYANNARSVLATGVSAVATTITISSGDEALFPTPIVGKEFFRLRITSAITPNSVEEIVFVTERVGNVLTVTRGQEGTTPQAWGVNSLCWNAATAGTYFQFMQPYYGVNTTGRNFYTVNTETYGHAYYTGMLVMFTALLGNTIAAPTLNVNGLGAIAITNSDGSTLLTGQIPDHSIVECVYNSEGPRWELVSLNGVAITALVNDNSNKIATTEFVTRAVANSVTPSDSNPLMNGTADPGISTNLSRGDHVHPTDTSRAPIASPTFTGTPTAPTPPAIDSSTKLATTEFVGRAIGNAGGIPAGSKTIFFNSAPPAGWALDTTNNNKAIRIVNTSGGGLGGTLPFTSAFASRSFSGTVGSTSLGINELPPHTHGVSDPGHNHSINDGGHSHGISDPGHSHSINDPGHSHVYTGQAPIGTNSQGYYGAVSTTSKATTASGTGISINGSSTGVGVYSSHANISANGSGTGISISSAGNGGGHSHSFTGSSVDFGVQYIDAIICVKL